MVSLEQYKVPNMEVRVEMVWRWKETSNWIPRVTKYGTLR